MNYSFPSQSCSACDLGTRIVIGYSGGVTSAWCLGWTLERFPKDQVVALFHDTKQEDEDTYRFLREMASALKHPITERSDGRSVEQVEDDEGALANNRMAFCSRILKASQRDKYFKELRRSGVGQIVLVLGFSGNEWRRIQRTTMRAEQGGYSIRFPVKELGLTKQQCADWCMSFDVRLPRMYAWSDHANCVGCRRGGKAYWLAVRENRPDVFEAASRREKVFGHTFLPDCSLETLAATGLRRAVRRRESIEIGSCECGD